MRYLSPHVLNDLSRKMVFLTGPRQSGKMTLVKSFFDQKVGLYLNWDDLDHKKMIMKLIFL